MMQTEKRGAPARVQIAFVGTEELRHTIKLRALMQGMTVREYLTDLVLRDQRAKEAATRK